jgi:hypothetical protein
MAIPLLPGSNPFWTAAPIQLPSLHRLPCNSLSASTEWLAGWRPFHTNLLVFTAWFSTEHSRNWNTVAPNPHTELTWFPQLSSLQPLGTDRQENTVSNSTCIVARRFVAAGRRLPSRCLETTVVYLLISWSLHSNASTRYNISFQRRIISQARKHHEEGGRACHLFHARSRKRNFSSETTVDFQRPTWRYAPEDRNFHNLRGENLKSYTGLNQFNQIEILFSGNNWKCLSVPRATNPPRRRGAGPKQAEAAALHTFNRNSRHITIGLFVFKHWNYTSKNSDFLVSTRNERACFFWTRAHQMRRTDGQTDVRLELSDLQRYICNEANLFSTAEL